MLYPGWLGWSGMCWMGNLWPHLWKKWIPFIIVRPWFLSMAVIGILCWKRISKGRRIFVRFVWNVEYAYVSWVRLLLWETLPTRVSWLTRIHRRFRDRSTHFIPVVRGSLRKLFGSMSAKDWMLWSWTRLLFWGRGYGDEVVLSCLNKRVRGCLSTRKAWMDTWMCGMSASWWFVWQKIVPFRESVSCYAGEIIPIGSCLPW